MPGAEVAAGGTRGGRTGHRERQRKGIGARSEEGLGLWVRFNKRLLRKGKERARTSLVKPQGWLELGFSTSKAEL